MISKNGPDPRELHIRCDALSQLIMELTEGEPIAGSQVTKFWGMNIVECTPDVNFDWCLK